MPAGAGARAGAGAGAGAGARSLSARHYKLSQMILNVSNYTLTALFKHRYRVVVDMYKEDYAYGRYGANYPLPQGFIEDWDDTPNAWRDFDWLLGPSGWSFAPFKPRNVVAHLEKTNAQARATLTSGDTSTWDTTILVALLQTNYSNSRTLGDDTGESEWERAKLKKYIQNPLSGGPHGPHGGYYQTGIDFIRICRNTFYAHVTSTNADRFVHEGIALTFEDVMAAIETHLLHFAKQVEPSGTGELHASIKAQIAEVNAIEVLSVTQLEELEKFKQTAESETLRASDVTNLVKLMHQPFGQERSQQVRKDEILVLGLIGNDSFDHVKKLWKDLEKQDRELPNGLDKEAVIKEVKRRVTKAKGDAALMAFLEEKGRWNIATQTFQPESEWDRLKDRAFAEAPAKVSSEQWLNKGFDAVNSREINEALLPGTESVARENVAATYRALIQGSGVRPARLATPFRPWEKRFGLDWRSTGSGSSGLSTIHATIRFVEGAQDLPESCFVLEEATGDCVVDVLDGSLNEKNEGHHGLAAVAGATAAAGTTRQPNFYVLEDGDILRFHHGCTPRSYSQLGMIRIRIPKVNPPGGGGGASASNATNASFVEQEQFFAESLTDECVAGIKRDNLANASQEKMEGLCNEVKELRSARRSDAEEIKELRKESKELRAGMSLLLAKFGLSTLSPASPAGAVSPDDGSD